VTVVPCPGPGVPQSEPMAEIVVGVDGSDHSAAALRWAAREADRRGHDLVAVLVWDLFNQHHADGTHRFDPEYGTDQADAALAAAVEAALGADAAATVVRRVVCDLPAPGLLSAADDADLLVVGARGVGGFRGLLLGSVSQQCLHHARVPIAIVRADSAEAGGRERVVVGVDGSEPSEAALRWALDEGAAHKAVVQVVHAWETPVIYRSGGGVSGSDMGGVESGAHRLVDDMIERLGEKAASVEVERTVVPGGPASSLLDAAEGADLVVVGRRGLGGFGRLLLGSVSEHVARHAPCPVVVVPTAAGA
jgi:nucleotide-binding universal stress UspA family protein